MSKLDKLRRNPMQFFADAKNPVLSSLGQSAVKMLRELSLNPIARELPRNPVSFFEHAENPALRAVGLAATKNIPALMRVAESLMDPVSTTIQRTTGAIAEQPLVSVVMATHNTELTIARAIESLLRQSYTNLEIIVIDDGSSDATWDIADEIAELDPRLVLVHNRRLRGATTTRNQAMAMAGGEYVLFHDATDVSHPARIERQVSELVANANSLVCTVTRRDARGRTMRKSPTSMLFRRQTVIDEIGFMCGTADGDRPEYLERIRQVFGADAERALVGLLCEAQSPLPSFEYADGVKKRLIPQYDESASWPVPTGRAPAPSTPGENNGAYVSYQPPEKRHVQLHKSSRRAEIRARIEVA